MKFINPSNNYIEEIPSDAWARVLLFGPLYFALRGIWTHCVASIFLAMMTMGMSWLIYPFFAKELMRTHYLRKGWLEF